MTTRLPRRVLGAAAQVRRGGRRTPVVLDVASFRQQILDLGADLDAIARLAAEWALSLCSADDALVEIRDGGGPVHGGKAGRGVRGRSRAAAGAREQPWRDPVSGTAQICDDAEADPRADR